MISHDRIKVGRIQSWIEDGTLKLYSHEVGATGGTSCSLSAEESMGLLELLSRHSADIDSAVHAATKQEMAYDYTGGWMRQEDFDSAVHGATKQEEEMTYDYTGGWMRQ